MKTLSILVLVLALVVSTAWAAEQLIEVTLTNDPVVAIDRNGNEYVRMIATFDRELNGVKYSVDLPVMAFGSTAEGAKLFKKGDRVKAICQNRKLSDGRESYNVVAFIK